jgi:hypothetical protein
MGIVIWMLLGFLLSYQLASEDKKKQSTNNSGCLFIIGCCLILAMDMYLMNTSFILFILVGLAQFGGYALAQRR